MNHESNTNNYTTEAKSFIAEIQGRTEFDDISSNKKACIASEMTEQLRRMEDSDGELLRRHNARVASNFIISANQANSKDFATVVKEAMQNAGANISAAASSAKVNTEEFGSKGWSLVRAKASEAGSKIQEVNLSEPIIDAKIALVNTAIHATQLAVDTGSKAAELGEDISRKASELSIYSEDKFYETTKLISDKSIVVAGTFERFIKFGDYAFELVSDVLKRITQRFAGWAQTTWSQAIYSANLQYNVNLAEKERKRRMTSEDESGAILNALAVSSLVKELTPEFYRPAEEPSRAYTFSLLEQKERRNRMVEERFTGNPSVKANQIAGLIKAHHTSAPVPAGVKELVPVFEAEQVIYPDPMQIFEEPRNIAAEFAGKKLSDSQTFDSPQALRLDM